MFISLGHACNVKYHIDQYVKQPTHFFDWLITDFESVIQLLEIKTKNKDIHAALNRDTLLIEPILDRTQVTMKGLGNCISIHGIPEKYTDTHIDRFLEQYVRRYWRLIETIQSCQKIVFIRWGHVSNSAAARFVATVKNINERCPFMLVIIDDKSAALKNGVLRIKLSTREVRPTDIAWHEAHYLWDNVWTQCALLGFSRM
jgi:hypothetical protein